MIARKRARVRPSLQRILQEAMSGVMLRASRSPLTVTGIALGVASFISVLGMTTSANGQINNEFLSAEATLIQVVPAGGEAADALFPDNADQAVAAINGVTAVGRSWAVSDAAVSRLSDSIVPPSTVQPPVRAATPGYWTLIGPTLKTGRVFDSFLRDQPVAVLGASVAKDLGISDLSDQTAVIVNGQRLVVIGIVRDTRGSSAALNSVTVPAEYARTHFLPPGQNEQMVVDTASGAAATVSKQIAFALNPRSPDTYKITPPPLPTLVRDRVGGFTQFLFYSLAGIGIVVSGVGIANVSLIGVIARTREIALRRSLGALPRHVAAQFLIESGVRGLLGGSLGTALGVATITIVCVLLGWSAIIEPWSLIVGPLLGVAVGTIAGLYPAIRATHVEPVEAFRQ
ncbi:ABC transporter permease [Microbacterium protaetiae]|uniref:ABC transporter permease n=1 Tax=Microbacterium protaetiae TaxID=2509458 RepID=A0A4P6EGX6_9MICO|nr:ABC transporter permease [Microbacterium protaetiae]QAY60419.1 ABC transporter permease [Microbacterium protaetiae]